MVGLGRTLIIHFPHLKNAFYAFVRSRVFALKWVMDVLLLLQISIHTNYILRLLYYFQRESLGNCIYLAIFTLRSSLLNDHPV